MVRVAGEAVLLLRGVAVGVELVVVRGGRGEGVVVALLLLLRLLLHLEGLRLRVVQDPRAVGVRVVHRERGLFALDPGRVWAVGELGAEAGVVLAVGEVADECSYDAADEDILPMV